MRGTSRGDISTRRQGRVRIKRPRERLSARAEAAGLNWLREASESVVDVIEVADDHLIMPELSPARPTPKAARTAGRELARIHLAGAPAHGAPPPGWDGPFYIGTQEMMCVPTPDWGSFYAEQRVLPFARRAAALGTMPRSGERVVERACAAIAARRWEIAPARLHGDLWAGNLFFTAAGPVFIDPAAHGGHPETDLAMLALFGAPYLDEIRAGYEEVRPLPEGWLDYTPMHQLHPVAVHAVTHGPAYGTELVRLAEATLDVLG